MELTATSIYEYAMQGLETKKARTALWFYGRSLTYGELFARVDCAAEELYALGVRQGTVVTIHLPNCPQAIIAIYAVAKLGAICDMVNALLPPEGLRESMAFTESTFLITGSHNARCGEMDFIRTLVYVDLAADMGAVNRFAFRLKSSVRRPEKAILFESRGGRGAVCPAPETLAGQCGVYMHSSGSTGTPKTVMLSHEALNNWVVITRVYFRNTDLSRQVCLSALPYFHALGFQMDMHRVLSSGGTLVLLSRWNGKTAVKFIKKHGVTAMAGVPSMCRDLLGQKYFSGKRIQQLRALFIGGEKMDPALKRSMDQRLNAGETPCVFEGYGLTETASACAVLEKDHYHIDASGYPQYGITCLVRQKDGSLLRAGEGEFVVAGNCLMMGYLKDPEATKRAFLIWEGKRYLRTGDYGRIDEEGLLYFYDRIKNTIIRKGNNIFPAEVETVIRGVKGVAEVCVIGLPEDTYGTEQVCACVVPQKGVQEAALREAVKNRCRTYLPGVAVPGRIELLDQIPKNHMAKIDRQALAQMIYE